MNNNNNTLYDQHSRSKVITQNFLGIMGQNCASISSKNPVELCRLEDVPNGGMKEITLPPALGDGSILLLRKDSEVKALSPKCTHYAAPLVKGTYDPDLGTVRCPFHGACFNVDNGDIEEYPGLDSLYSYKVRASSDGKVYFEGIKEGTGIRRVQPPLKMDLKEDPRTIVIVGSGGAAQACLETLRGPDCKFRGRIIMVTKEDCLPYDRPKLSKAMGTTPEEVRLRQPEFFSDRDIEVKMGLSLVSIHPTDKHILLSNDDTIQYDKLVLATGTIPRVLDIPGSDLENIFVLRTPQDANAIIASSTGKRVVVIGSSFIGTEVAASLSGKASEVTLVGNSKALFEKTLGKEVGSLVQEMHEKKGVKFALGVRPTEYHSSNEKTVESVRLSDGSDLPADVVVLGVGVVPKTKAYLGSNDPGIETDERGYIQVNERMETSVDGIYAAGDVVKFPLFTHNNQSFSIGHWGLAKSQGRTAAINAAALGISESPKAKMMSVPFFWTVQYGKSFRVAGFADAYDEIITDGSITEGKFVSFYIKDGNVMSVASLMRDPIPARFADFTRKGNVLRKEEIQAWINA